MRKLLAALVAILVPSLAHAFSPVRYVQISTNTLTRQSGTAVFTGLNVSTETISTSTVTNLTVSSNTMLSGATFYQGANIDFSSATQVNISTVDWNTNGTLGLAERCYKESIFSITSSSATTVSAFVPTTLTGSITPHITTSYIKIRVSGTMQGTANQNGYLTILRGGSDISGSAQGFASISPPAGSVQAVPISMVFDDSPASLSAQTYAVGVQSSGGATTTFCNLGKCVMALQECF